LSVRVWFEGGLERGVCAVSKWKGTTGWAVASTGCADQGLWRPRGAGGRSWVALELS
jgi:hypothetical protein